MTGQVSGDATQITIALAANLAALASPVAELRHAQQHAAQAAAAEEAAARLHAACARNPFHRSRRDWTTDRQPSEATAATGPAHHDSAAPPRPGHPWPEPAAAPTGPAPPNAAAQTSRA
jgi:hypothetical protein